MPGYHLTSCCKEVKNTCKKHSCSKNEKPKFLQGCEISDLLAPTETYQVCKNNFLRIQRENKKKLNSRMIEDISVPKDESPTKRIRRCFEDCLKDDLKKHQYSKYKPIRDLGSVHRNRIIKSISHQVLASVINVDRLEEEGLSYLHQNKIDLSVDVAFILSSVTQMISKWVKHDIKHHCKDAMPPPPEVKCSEMTISKDAIATLDYLYEIDQASALELSQNILIETSSKGHNKIRLSISKALKIPIQSIPSYYLATKHRCKLIAGEIAYLNAYKHLLPKSKQHNVNVTNDENDYLGQKNKVSKRYFAKIDGSASKIYALLLEKVQRKMLNYKPSDIIMFDSFDGANHLETAEGKIDLVSFSSTIVNQELLQLSSYSTAKSSSILTFMQVAAKEEPCMLLSVLKQHYESKIMFKEELSKQGTNLTLYDVHDAKMLYNLTQHSQWNRKYHPFVLCKCKRGKAAVNARTHKCQIISDADQLKYHNKSITKFKEVYDNKYDDRNVDNHRNWADVKNNGITHFGLHPTLLPYSSIAFDNLHCRLSIVRSIWSYIREYICAYSFDIQEKFIKILRLQLGEYYVACYETGKNLSVMHGEQIEQFLVLIPKIADFLKTELEQTRKVKALLKLLHYYPLLDSFMRISIVKDKDKYEIDIVSFKSNLILYQEAASETILTNHTIGDNESFYSHVLFCYYPQLIDRLWTSHNVGIGIFTLQGFERRNKESKNAARRFYNGKHNVCSQTMNRVFDLWWFAE
jgi:hypothetical protein